MAGEDGTATGALEFRRALEREPYRYRFYKALRELECAFSEHPRFGKSLRVGDDPVRLSQEPSLAFAPSELASFADGDEETPARLAVFFYGMFGPNGPLPLHLTEHARSRIRNHDDATFSRFLDVFHHRMISLLYRAWADAEPTVQFDRPESDRFSTYVGALMGLGMPSLRDRDAMPDLAKFHHAGLFAAPTRHADGLEQALAGFFDLPVRIEQFVGQWLELPSDCHLRLGESPETGALGLNTTIGTRIWERQQKFRIVVGPLDWADYARLLPGGESFRRLEAVVRNYTNDEWTWDLNLILRREEVPSIRLGGEGRLGWTTWLTDELPESDPADLYVQPTGP